MAIYSRLLLCLIAVVMGAMAVSGVANAQTPCAAADALFAGRLYEQAGAQYGEVLKQDATQSCAQEGLSKVAEIQGRATAEYRLGQGYEAAKQTEAARSHYIASLNIDPTYGPSLTALNNILTPAADTPPTGDDEKFGAVRLLLRLGFKDAAEEQVKKIVGDNPVIKVPADVQDQFTGDLQPWHNLKDATWPWLRSAGEVLLLGVIAYVLFLALRRKFSPATRIAVADFEASSESLKGSKGMSAIVQDALSKSDEGEAIVRRDLVDGSVQPASISLDLSSVLPNKFAILSTVLDWLLPSKVVKLTGMVHAPEPASRGAGITASLVESSSGKVFDTITIWQKDFDTAGATAQAGSQSSDEKGDAMAYSRLAEMAAIWAQFRINNTWPPDYLKKRQKASAGRGTQGATYTRLGTDSWESYALFRMGVRAALSDDAEGARQLYYRALDKDDKNRGALFNLGAIEIAWHNYDIAIDLLCRARESSEREAGFHSQEIAGGIVLEMAWYNTMYQLAAVHSYKGEDDPTCQTKALEYVSELVDTLQRTLAFLQQNTTPKARRDAIWNSERERFEEYHQMVDMGRLEKALVDFREGCLLAKAVILVLSDRFEEAEKLYRDQVEGHGKGYEPITLYNLACYYSQVGEAKRRNSAASATPGTAKTVGATSNNGKVDTSVQRDDGREELEAALRNLEASFEIEARKSDLDWAIQDPSLKGVRTDKDTFERFLTIIGKYAGRVDNGMPLSVVADIGRYYATLLKEEGINSPIQLLRHTITEAARKELADKVGVSQASLQKWISLSEMMVALDIEAPMANLLEVAEVGSLGLLKDASAEELSRRMQERNAGEFYVKKQLLPSAASIAYWTKIARLIDDRALSLEAAHAKAAKDAVPHGVHGLIKSLVHIFAGGTAGNVGQGTSNGGKAQDSAGENKPGLTEVQ